MKRAPVLVLAGTIAGLAGMLSFHSRAASTTALAGQSGTSGQAGQRSSARPGGPGAARAPAGSGTRRHATRAAAGVRTATGALEQYGYGELAVRVTAAGNRITSVTVPTLQAAESYSQQLASQVIPTLRSEVLAGQTAHINGVSGATYTSQAYAMSLQAALDKLHLR